MTILTGGSGKLGQELTRWLEVYCPPHKEFDITKEIKPIKADMVIHCAAYTNVQEAEKRKGTALLQNTYGTYNLANAYRNTPFVYISSEYAGNPVNMYSHSKRMGELIVQQLCNPYLIIRTLFKPRPYPFEYAFTDQFTKGDYLDVIGKLIADEIKNWDFKNKTVHVGTERKTMFDLAKQTKPDIKPNSIKNMKVRLPNDYA